MTMDFKIWIKYVKQHKILALSISLGVLLIVSGLVLYYRSDKIGKNQNTTTKTDSEQKKSKLLRSILKIPCYHHRQPMHQI